MEVLSELGPLFYMWNASGWAFFFFKNFHEITHSKTHRRTHRRRVRNMVGVHYWCRNL